MRIRGMRVWLVGMASLILVSGIFAQGKQKVSEGEFSRITDEAQAKTFASVHVSTMKSEGVSKTSLSKPDYFITEIFESNGTDRSRRVRTMERSGESADVTQTVRIGDIEYKRENAASWTKETRAPGIRSTSGGSFRATGEVPKNAEKFTFRQLGSIELNGIVVQHYEAEKFREYQISPTSSYAYTVFESYWIRADGKLAQRRSRTVQKGGKVTSDMIVTYEYPVEVTIEAPSER